MFELRLFFSTLVCALPLAVAQNTPYTHAAAMNIFWDKDMQPIYDKGSSYRDISWSPVELQDDLKPYKGVFSYWKSAGALIKTWTGDSPPDDSPAYGVSSALEWMLNVNKTFTSFGLKEGHPQVTFRNFDSGKETIGLKLAVLDVPFITYEQYGIALLQLNATAKELIRQGFTFYEMSDQVNPGLTVESVSYRTSAADKRMLTGQGNHRYFHVYMKTATYHSP